MQTAIAITVIVLGTLAWVGQLLSALVPATAAKLGLIERPDQVDPAFFADARGEAIWDVFALWGLPLAGVLLLLGHPGWPTVGVVGGAVYVYFAGRGIVTRAMLRRWGIRIGPQSTTVVYTVTLLLWGASGAAMTILALVC